MAEPTITRFNGFQFVAGQVIPRLIKQQVETEFTVPDKELFNGSLGLTYSGTVMLCNIRTRLPVTDRSVTVELQPGDGSTGKARVRWLPDPAWTSGDAARAPHLTATLQLRLKSTLPFLPRLSSDITVCVHGLSANLDLTLAQEAGRLGLKMESVEIDVDRVTLSDTGWIKKVATFLLALGKQETKSLDEWATVAIRQILGKVGDIADRLTAVVNKALEAGIEVKGHLPDTASPIRTGLSLLGLTSTDKALLARWQFTPEPSRTGGLPELTFTELQRPTQDLNEVLPLGDMELFLPLEAIDRLAWAAAEAGAFPRTVRGNYGELRYEGEARFTGPVRALPGEAGGDLVALEIPLAVDLTGQNGDGTATLIARELKLTLRAGATLVPMAERGLGVQITGAAIAGLEGQMALGQEQQDANELKASLEAFFATELRRNPGVLPLFGAVSSIMEPYGMARGPVSVGSCYIRIPYTFTPSLKTVFEGTAEAGLRAVVPFALEGGAGCVLHAGDGAVRLARVTESGLAELAAETWLPGGTAIASYDHDGVTYFLVCGDADGGTMELRRLKPDGSGTELVEQGACPGGVSQIVPLSLDGAPCLCTYRAGGRVTIERLKMDGSGLEQLFAGTMPTDIAAILPVTVQEQPHLLVCRAGGAANVHRIESGGTGLMLVSASKLMEGASQVLLYPATGVPQVLAYDSKSGQTAICRLTPDGRTLEEVYRATWNPGLTHLIPLRLPDGPAHLAYDQATGSLRIDRYFAIGS